MNFEDQDNIIPAHFEDQNTIPKYSEVPIIPTHSEEEHFEFSQELFSGFPNEAYADLMRLVLKNKLSNTTGNEIISFFNKHSNLSISPLPKNIQQGYTYMNKIKQPNLEYSKTCVLNYNGTEYFLYHWPLISCIKNILEIPDLLQNFAFNFKASYKYNQVFKILYKLIKLI